MRKSRRRLWLSGWSGVLLLNFLLVGCESGNQHSANGPTATVDPPVSESFIVSEKPLTLSIFYFLQNNVFNDNWPVFKQAAEWTNITLHGTIPQSATNADQLFHLMMTSGSIDDIVETTKDNFSKYGSQGEFVPLDTLIDQYAPHYKAFLEQNPDVRRNATSADGHMYFIPFVSDGELSTGWFIRQDWLDKLNLDVPTNVQQFHDVLTAFRDGDPNGNGKQDEIPYFMQGKEYGIYYLLGLFDVGCRDFCLSTDGSQVVFGAMDDAYAAAIQKISDWYNEGLIDPEIFTRGSEGPTYLFGNDLAGSTHDWFGSASSFNDTMQSKVPGFSLLPIAPPASESGRVIEWDYRNRNKDFGWGISAQNAYPEETMKYFDFWFTDEGRRLSNFGVEGQHYTMVDGKPTFTDEILRTGTVNVTLRNLGAQLGIGFQQDFEYEKQWTNAIGLKGLELYTANNYVKYHVKLPILPYTIEEEAEVKKLKGAIEDYRDEQAKKWILRNEKVADHWEEYSAALKRMGIDELLEIMNRAYNRYKS
ncbi:extracellular solute-binding protein [Paenibacillus sp. HB172176]|uniref:extracellular solute-binding protein n=1 Tax=Paenibacillus sp. HB172176 TaxID=2493690 RepID=UPI00143A891B|nr:extracellular solute-binding protein [Paenibacillus sp. HB172176]